MEGCQKNMELAKNTSRLLNIELLRIVAMFLITAGHYYAWFIEPNLQKYDIISADIYSKMLMFITFHVNTFVLISGYFGIKDSVKGLKKLYPLCLFYSIINVFSQYLRYGTFDLLKLIFPISHGGWWFINIYACLVIIAPIINRALNGLDKKGWYSILASICLINVYFGFFQHMDTIYHYGYDIINMSCVYIIGRFLATSYFKIPSIKVSSLLFIGSILTKISFSFLESKIGIDLLLGRGDYNNPLLILAAVSFFCFFLNIRISLKWVPFFSKSAIAIYLCTALSVAQEYIALCNLSIYKYFGGSPLSALIAFFVVMLLIFVTVTIIDQARLFFDKVFNIFLNDLLKHANYQEKNIQ